MPSFDLCHHSIQGETLKWVSSCYFSALHFTQIKSPRPHSGLKALLVCPSPGLFQAHKCHFCPQRGRHTPPARTLPPDALTCSSSRYLLGSDPHHPHPQTFPAAASSRPPSLSVALTCSTCIVPSALGSIDHTLQFNYIYYFLSVSPD